MLDNANRIYLIYCVRYFLRLVLADGLRATKDNAVLGRHAAV